jgi:hypothetical protein
MSIKILHETIPKTLLILKRFIGVNVICDIIGGYILYDISSLRLKYSEIHRICRIINNGCYEQVYKLSMHYNDKILSCLLKSNFTDITELYVQQERNEIIRNSRVCGNVFQYGNVKMIKSLGRIFDENYAYLLFRASLSNNIETIRLIFDMVHSKYKSSISINIICGAVIGNHYDLFNNMLSIGHYDITCAVIFICKFNRLNMFKHLYLTHVNNNIGFPVAYINLVCIYGRIEMIKIILEHTSEFIRCVDQNTVNFNHQLLMVASYGISVADNIFIHACVGANIDIIRLLLNDNYFRHVKFDECLRVLVLDYIISITSDKDIFIKATRSNRTNGLYSYMEKYHFFNDCIKHNEKVPNYDEVLCLLINTIDKKKKIRKNSDVYMDSISIIRNELEDRDDYTKVNKLICTMGLEHGDIDREYYDINGEFDDCDDCDYYGYDDW